MSPRAGAAERVPLTTDDATMQRADGLALLLHAQGFVVERRAFVHAPTGDPRRVMPLALERPLPACVALVRDGRRAAPRGQPESLIGARGPDIVHTGPVIDTIGHSTRPQEEFIAVLRHYGIVTLVDIRSMPRSRHNPQFNREELEQALPACGLRYVYLAQLGGLRHGLGADSPNTGWRNASFRAYADYMMTDAFRQGLAEALALAHDGPAALMCAEAVPWRCHRSLVADALVARGVVVRDIYDARRAAPHRLPSFACVAGDQVTYPPEVVA